MSNKEKNEENLLKMAQQKEKADKLLLKAEIIIGVQTIASFFLSLFAASRLEGGTWLKILLLALGVVLMIIGMVFALKIEQLAGYYECAKCHHKYVPAYRQVLFAYHVNRTRYMKCPKCGKKSWNRKVLSKE